ncbi:hypothetical protein GCM10025869_03850 [Homoserinibacter gongjuensis]|uniref:Uncharacterized protein n=1 Tax=Homoserinibacter gongjuensis TaxID=1162968 RepID=A0ABQ6JT50_9MICO|nr:hypothetical protein GCM10025869_03850 [Homoserinibacter gongjuensis]
MRWDWRAWRDRLVHLWRGSLRARTIVITVLLSAIAVTVVGVVISTSVRTNLFDSRRDQVLAEAARAAEQAQRTFTNASELGDAGDVQATADSALDSVQRSTTASYLGFLRTPGQSQVPNVIDPRVSTADFERTFVSQRLAETVAEGDGSEIAWQPVAIPTEAGTDPGITTGAHIDTVAGESSSSTSSTTSPTCSRLSTSCRASSSRPGWRSCCCSAVSRTSSCDSWSARCGSRPTRPRSSRRGSSKSGCR